MATYYTDVTTFRTLKYKGLAVADIDADQLENACKLAHDRINSRLGRRYSVPFDTTTPPAQIREISDCLVVYFVKMFGAGHSVRPKGPWKDEYDGALEWLERIVKGEDIIVGVSPKQSLESSTRGEHPVFAPVEDELDYGQDVDQADRISDERD